MSELRSNFSHGLLPAVDESSAAFIKHANVTSAKSQVLSSSSSYGAFPYATSDTESTDIDSGDLPFCTKDNINDCITYLSQEFTAIGLPSLVASSDKESFEATHLINATYHLLQRFQRCVRSRDDLQDSKYRAESDLEHQQLEKRRLQSRIEQLERELSQVHLREKQLIKMNQTISNKLKTEKEEVKRLQIVIQSRDAQYKHGMKKKEMELVKLKDRLHVLLIDKTDQKIGMEMSDMLQRSDGRRGRWQSSATNVEEELYRSIISSYEEKQKVLMVENHEMRRSLSNLQMKLNELLHSDASQDCKVPETVQTNESVSESDFLSTSCSDDTESPTNVKSGHFMMPYSLVQEDILSDIREKLAAVKNYVKRLEACGTEHKDDTILQKIEEKYKADIERLQKKLERYRCLIEQNQSLLSECAQHSKELMHQSGPETDLTAERNQLMQEKRMFYEQLVVFEEKKRALADVEFHLNKERIALEMTKFHMSPASGTVAAVSLVGDVHRPLSAQPTPVSVRQKANTKRFLPSTPSAVTSKPSGKISSSGERKATTAERSHSASCGVAYDISRSLGHSKTFQKLSVQESSPASLCSSRCKQPSSSSHESSPMSYDASMKQVQRLKSADVISRHQDK